MAADRSDNPAGVIPGQPSLSNHRRSYPILQVFASRRMAVVLLTGFSSGLPLALTGPTLAAWLRSRHVDLTSIGLLNLVTLPYALKFLWSPLMDRFVPPFLGRRRGWMLISQVALMAGIAAMAIVGTLNPWILAAMALLVAFFSASQDIVVDAYRTDILGADELGPGAALYTLGYRVGWVASASLALILAGCLSWSAAYLLMAAAMMVGVIATVRAPEPAEAVKPSNTLRQAIVPPFADFFRRHGAVEMLVFVLIYKFDAAMVSAMTTPFMTDVGFTLRAIGLATGLGIFFTIVGAMIGGAMVVGIGIRRSLWTFGLLQGLAGLSFTALAVLGKNYPMMVTAVVVESICSGMATSAFVGFIMSLCNKRFTVTQIALLTSLMAVGRTLAGTAGGWLADQVAWPTYFIVSTLIAIPGLLLLLRYRTWQDGESGAQRETGKI